MGFVGCWQWQEVLLCTVQLWSIFSCVCDSVALTETPGFLSINLHECSTVQHQKMGIKTLPKDQFPIRTTNFYKKESSSGYVNNIKC